MRNRFFQRGSKYGMSVGDWEIGFDLKYMSWFVYGALFLMGVTRADANHEDTTFRCFEMPKNIQRIPLQMVATGAVPLITKVLGHLAKNVTCDPRLTEIHQVCAIETDVLSSQLLRLSIRAKSLQIKDSPIYKNALEILNVVCDKGKKMLARQQMAYRSLILDTILAVVSAGLGTIWMDRTYDLAENRYRMLIISNWYSVLAFSAWAWVSGIERFHLSADSDVAMNDACQYALAPLRISPLISFMVVPLGCWLGYQHDRYIRARQNRAAVQVVAGAGGEPDNPLMAEMGENPEDEHELHLEEQADAEQQEGPAPLQLLQ